MVIDLPAEIAEHSSRPSPSKCELRPHSEGIPSMDRAGNMFRISLRRLGPPYVDIVLECLLQNGLARISVPCWRKPSACANPHSRP